MNKIILSAVMAIAGLAGATTTFAADQGLYFLAGAGQPTGSSDKPILDNALVAAGGVGFSSSLKEPIVYKLQIGYQVNKNLAFEGGYLGSNDEEYSASGGNLVGPVNASANITGWNVNAVGILPLNEQFSLLAKFGVASIRISATVTGPGGSSSADGSKTGATYGLGAKYDFTKDIFGRFDVDSYDIGSSTSSNRSNSWLLSIGFRF